MFTKSKTESGIVGSSVRKLVGIFFLLSTVYGPLPTALAQGECGLQTDPGNPETVICDPQDYPGGITYDSLGDLTLEVPDDSVDLRVLDDGVSVTGIGADNIFWDSSAFVSGDIVGDVDAGSFDGAVLDYLSDTGNVDILVGGAIQGFDNASHAIRAESTGGGNVSVTTNGTVNPRGGFRQPDPSGIGIEALTTSGDIVIDANADVQSFDTAPYAIHAGSSAGGNIDIATADIVFGRDDASHAILAETTGTGAINIGTAGSVIGFDGTSIEATTGGGDITVNATGKVGNAGNGRHGIIAETGGAGEIVLNLLGDVEGDGRDFAGAAVGIRAVTGTGNITINTTNVFMRRGTAIETQTDGLATINLEGSLGIQRAFAHFGATPTSGAETAIRSSGGSVVVNANRGSPVDDLDDYLAIAAPFDFSGLSGGATVNFGPFTAWSLSDPESTLGPFMDRSVFSPAADTVNIAAGALLTLPIFRTPDLGGIEPLNGESETVEEDIYRVEFGAGADVVNNAGTVIVSGISLGVGGIREPPPSPESRLSYQGEMRLEGLAEFNNSGTIWLGASLGKGFQQSFAIRSTDFQPDDIFAAPGAAFHGGPGSRIVLDADLGKIGQSSCGFAARTIVEDVIRVNDIPIATGDLINDCVDLTGGSATGRTEVFIQQLIPGDRGAYIPDGNVVVDLTGGDPAATEPDAFVIAPGVQQYSPAFGGIIDKGLFLYKIAFDADAQQFKLYGVPAASGQQFALLGESANRLWRTATDAWFERRPNQRDVDLEAGYGGGVWFRVSRDEGERDAVNPIALGSETLVFDNSYNQDDTTLTVGGDLISRSTGDIDWVAGLMGGHVQSKIGFDNHRSRAALKGMHFGAYGSVTLGEFYLDAAVNQTRANVDFDVPAMELQPEGTILETDVASTGAQIEAGWRMRLGRLAVEPLASFSYVTSDFDLLDIPAEDPARFGAEVEFEDPTSQRGSLGVRLTMEDLLVFVPSSTVGITARAIEEFDGESEASIINLGPLDAPVTATLDGTFGQVSADVSLANARKSLSGYLKVDGMFHDDYESVGVSAGFRYQW